MSYQEKKRILDLLDAHQSNAEFKAMIERNRLLHICKQKGFPRLKKMGLIKDSPRPVSVRRQICRQKMLDLANTVNQMHHEGIEMSDICKELKTTEYTIRRALRFAKIKILKNRKQMFDIEEALYLANQGYSTSQLGERFNCTRQAISEKLRKNGYTYNKQLKGYTKC